MAGGQLNLPSDAGRLSALFRACALDGTSSAAYPGDVAGDVELPDGVSVSLAADRRGPLVKTDGTVTVAGGGTVTLPDARASGAWTIAHGATVDASADALATWRVANMAPSSRAVFKVLANGDFVCLVFTPATCVIVR